MQISAVAQCAREWGEGSRVQRLRHEVEPEQGDMHNRTYENILIQPENL